MDAELARPADVHRATQGFGAAMFLPAAHSVRALAGFPEAPPFYLDLPTKDGVPQPAVLARWAANSPLAMVDQYVTNLRRYTGIALDVGDRDGLRTDTAELHRLLDSYGIGNTFDVYPGDHVSAVADRMQNHVLPYFSRTLEFTIVAK